MSLLYPYRRVRMTRPVPSLGGNPTRPRPLITVALVGPAGVAVDQGLLDTGADDTVFPDDVAVDLGIDLTQAPVGEAGGVGGSRMAVRYAQVTLRITDGREFREWTGWVAFTSAPLTRPLLGYAGFLQFFTAIFRGDREEVELTVNSLYQGT